MPIYFNNINTISTQSEFGPDFYDVINSGTKFDKNEKVKEKDKYIEKKRKRDNSLISSYIISNNDDNKKETTIKNDNLNETITIDNKKIKFVEIS